MPIDVIKNFGSIVKETRIQRSLTQQQLADRCDISLRHMANIEKGKANPSLEIVYIIIKELNIPANAVFYSDMEGYNKEDEEIMILLKSINSDKKEFIKRTILFLIDEAEELD